MTLDEADAIPLGTELMRPQLFVKGNIRATLTPRYLTRADILVLRMLMDNDVRALHFSRTSANLAEELGLGAYVVTQGMVRKVLPDSAAPSDSVVHVPGEGLVNVERTTELWEEYRSPASLIEKGDWIDYSSRGIPFLVLNTGIVTAEALARSGQEAKSDSVLQTARQVGIAMRFGDILGDQLPPPPPIPSGDSTVGTQVPRQTVPAPVDTPTP